MPHRYSTALSHLVLAGTGLYCLLKTKGLPLHCPYITFAIITLNSLIGVWRWGNPDYGNKVDKIYKFTSYLQYLFAMPSLTSTIWLAYEHESILSLSWELLPIGALVFYFLEDERHRSDTFMEILIPASLMALSVVCFGVENYYGVATAISYAIDHYCVLKQEGNFNIPAQDLYNYGLCFFAYFALRSIQD